MNHHIDVPVENLQPGMYVCGLDRPWLETPFHTQGFYITCESDVTYVGKYCTSVVVDPRRRQPHFAEVRKAKMPKPMRVYQDSRTLKEELDSAQSDLEQASDVMSDVFARLAEGIHLDVEVVRSVINPMVESVLRNNEAMAALVRLQKCGDYLYQHSIAVAVWAAILGRHLGLQKKKLQQVTLGAALIDVGMASIDGELRLSPGQLSDEETQYIRTHVPLGVQLLSHKRTGLPQDVIDMIATHHERHDGSGYPHGLKGMDIPLFGRVAGIVDSYDAMITQRPFAESRSSFDAIQELADVQDRLFHGALVEQFMQAIGLFPTGSIVELSTREVAVVVRQNEARRLRPKVVVILDDQGRKKTDLVTIDLAKYTHAEAGTDLWISRELDASKFDVQLEDYFV